MICAMIIVSGAIISTKAENTEWTDWIPASQAPSVYYEKTPSRTEYRYRSNFQIRIDEIQKHIHIVDLSLDCAVCR